jgi:hypothetical protein
MALWGMAFLTVNGGYAKLYQEIIFIFLEGLI